MGQLAIILSLGLLTAGCAGALAPSTQPDDRIPKLMAEPESTPTRTEDELRAQLAEDASDPDAQVIDMAGEDGEPEPSQAVVAQPERGPMPSMMPGVVTGPTGGAPGG